MARLSVHLPPEVLTWLEKRALDERRSVSQAASVIVQEFYENDVWVPDGSYAELVSAAIAGMELQSTPVMDAVKKIRARRPGKPTFPSPSAEGTK